MDEMMEGIRQDGIDKVWWDCESTCSAARRGDRDSLMRSAGSGKTDPCS